MCEASALSLDSAMFPATFLELCFSLIAVKSSDVVLESSGTSM